MMIRATVFIALAFAYCASGIAITGGSTNLLSAELLSAATPDGETTEETVKSATDILKEDCGKKESKGVLCCAREFTTVGIEVAKLNGKGKTSLLEENDDDDVEEVVEADKKEWCELAKIKFFPDKAPEPYRLSAGAISLLYRFAAKVAVEMGDPNGDEMHKFNVYFDTFRHIANPPNNKGVDAIDEFLEKIYNSDASESKAEAINIAATLKDLEQWKEAIAEAVPNIPSPKEQ